MKSIRGKKKIILLGIAAVIAVALAVGAFVLRQGRNSQDGGDQQSLMEDDPNYQREELEFTPPLVYEVKEQYPDEAEQYGLFFQYALTEEALGNIDAAVGYTEAAIEVAPDDESKDLLRYNLYRMGRDNNNTELMNKYRDILGEDWITKHEEPKPRSDTE